MGKIDRLRFCVTRHRPGATHPLPGLVYVGFDVPLVPTGPKGHLTVEQESVEADNLTTKFDVTLGAWDLLAVTHNVYHQFMAALFDKLEAAHRSLGLIDLSTPSPFGIELRHALPVDGVLDAVRDLVLQCCILYVEDGRHEETDEYGRLLR